MHSNMGKANQRNLVGGGIRPIWPVYMLGHKGVPLGRGEWRGKWQIEESIATPTL